MRKIVVLSFITRYYAGSRRTRGRYFGRFQIWSWTVPYFDEFLGKVMVEQMSKPFDLLLGRKTYEMFASYWPHHKEEGAGINQATKYVASHGTMQFTWDKSVLLQGDIVDELWFKIFPVTLGSGKRLFAEGTIPVPFKLTDGKVLQSGVIIANYERAG